MNKRKSKSSLTITLKIDDKSFSKYFKAFGDPTRLKILKLLAANDLTVNEIVDEIGLSQPTISRHLSILREAGIVTDNRDGQHVIYSLMRENVGNCCTGFCDCLSISSQFSKKDKKK